MKYLDDPFKKVSYSFRIEERLLEDIKLYSKATGKKLPETFNDLLKESIEGVTVDNTYLNGFKRQLITIPNTIDMAIEEDTLSIMETSLLNPDLEGLEYEVKQIPNNLDVWDNRKPILDMTRNPPSKINGKGYKSRDYPELLHEGIEFVLIPDLIKPKHIESPYISDGQTIALYNCLVPIYFTVELDNTLDIEVISMKDALSKIKDINNFELLDEVKALNKLVQEIIDNVILNLDIREEAQETYYFKGSTYTYKPSFLAEVCYYLQNKLLETLGTNSSNVISNYGGGLERWESKQKESPESKEDVKDSPPDEIDKGFYNIIRDLKLENERLKEDNNSLRDEFKKLKETVKSIEKTQKNNLEIIGVNYKD